MTFAADSQQNPDKPEAASRRFLEADPETLVAVSFFMVRPEGFEPPAF